MEMQPLNSSHIVGAGWADETLRIDFRNGTSYKYAPVPRRVFDDFIKAPSVGQFFHTAIKHQFECTKDAAVA